jgi:hypothetical protein
LLMSSAPAKMPSLTGLASARTGCRKSATCARYLIV